METVAKVNQVVRFYLSVLYTIDQSSRPKLCFDGRLTNISFLIALEFATESNIARIALANFIRQNLIFYKYLRKKAIWVLGAKIRLPQSGKLVAYAVLIAPRANSINHKDR